MAKRILILGGTTEARELAAALARRPDIAVTVSLAGRTAQVVEQGAPTRIGGFGGAPGLAAHLRAERIDGLVDATHPYAAEMSANAARAARETGTPFLALRRPPWRRQAGDDWTEVAGEVEAVAALGSAPRRVFLALGRGPFTEAGDRALIEAHRIGVVVARNSGGSAAYGKIAAARALRLPVVLIARPPLPEVAAIAGSVEEALAWLDHALALRGE